MRSFAANLLPALLLAGAASSLSAQSFYRRPPNDYRRTADRNVATDLNQRLAAGVAVLEWEPQRGRLDALLRALGISPSSQTLVFSKTSLQRHRIGPGNPRALYFGSDAYVGWIPGARNLEVAVGDDLLGLAFYTLTQRQDGVAQLVRSDSCLSCHGSARTESEPGLLLRSVFPDASGDPLASAGESRMDHRAPIRDRWGGWLVTGKLQGRHRGNGVARLAASGSHVVDGAAGDDLHALLAALHAGDAQPADGPAEEDLGGLFTFLPDRYPAPTSDIAALLALEHQASVHNLLIRASMQARYLVDKDARLAGAVLDGKSSDVEAASREASRLQPSTVALMDRLAGDIVAELLLDGEADLSSHAVRSEPRFAQQFEQQWPSDESGLALGKLDLTKRTFTLPLSPMVHAPAFRRMPTVLRESVLRRLAVAIVRGVTPGSVRLRRSERTALEQHLRATLPEWGAHADRARRPPHRARRNHR
ncbi:MAG: hypothetical protein AB8H80_22710 [Planctomycetota bacterium]